MLYFFSAFFGPACKSQNSPSSAGRCSGFPPRPPPFFHSHPLPPSCASRMQYLVLHSEFFLGRATTKETNNASRERGSGERSRRRLSLVCLAAGRSRAALCCVSLARAHTD